MKLMIVDDEIITINGIKKGVHWDELPFEQVLSATTVAAAKEILQKETVEIVLCDIEMPRENGIDLLDWIREKGLQTECIFLTCHSEFQYVQRAMQLEGMDYLLKPVPYDELQKILKKAAEKADMKLLDRKYRDYGRSLVEEKKTEAKKPERTSAQIIEEVRQYINSHLEEDLNAELLARQVYVSPTYLFRIFKQEEGRTLVDYITDLRLFHAAEMLKSPDTVVGRAAIMSGYNNYAYFTKVFKKKYGVTPSQYQKNYQNKQENV